MLRYSRQRVLEVLLLVPVVKAEGMGSSASYHYAVDNSKNDIKSYH